MTEAQNSITYSSVVSRESIRIDFLLASIHGVETTAIDLQNAYLNEPYAEKIWFVGVNECREDKGRVLLIFRALYGLYAGFLWRSALAAALWEIGLKPTMEEPKVWIRV